MRTFVANRAGLAFGQRLEIDVELFQALLSRFETPVVRATCAAMPADTALINRQVLKLL
jgi:hypothetical protein